MDLHGKRALLILISLTMAACAISPVPEPESAPTSTTPQELPTSTPTPIPVSPTDESIAPTGTLPPPTAEEEADETEVGEIVLQVQAQEGKAAAEGGVLLPAGESVSFDAVGRPESGVAGFWRSIDDAKYTVLFVDPDGEILSLVQLRGAVRWDKQANLIEGKESFLRIQVESGIWLDIVDREVVNGQLSLVDENGDGYVVLGYGALFQGTMDMK